MLTLVYGGSGSGKSSFAESLTTGLETKNKIYLATMQVYDDEGRQKVKRHQDMRSKKGFSTIEAPRDIIDKLEASLDDTTILLECMSNLVANEMFAEEVINDEEQVVDKVSREVLSISKKAKNMIIVSNNIFEDGCNYDETTRAYMRALSKINELIAKESDEVWEIVVGIPVRLK